MYRQFQISPAINFSIAEIFNFYSVVADCGDPEIYCLQVCFLMKSRREHALCAILQYYD